MAESSPRSVLLVDDDREQLEMNASLLRQLGLAPSIASGPAAALRRLAEENFDLVVTDLRMETPADGFIVADAAKLLNPGVRVVLTTGTYDLPEAMRHVEQAVDAVLLKPFSAQHLTAALNVSDMPPLPRMGMIDLIREQRDWLLGEWRRARESDPALAHLTPQQRNNDLSNILDEVLTLRTKDHSAEHHGQTRREQAVSLAGTLSDLIELRRLMHVLVTKHYARLDPPQLNTDLSRLDAALDQEIIDSVRGRAPEIANLGLLPPRPPESS